MARAACLVCLASWCLGAGGEQTDARQIVERAIAAHGGAKRLGALPAVLLRGKGTFYGVDRKGLAFTGQWAIEGPDRLRFTVEMTVEGQRRKLTEVVNGKRGWRKLPDNTTIALVPSELAEERRDLYAGWLATLAPLRDKSYQLTALPEVDVNGRPAVGVKVARQQQPDVRLYFDKQTNLLVKSAFVIKTPIPKSDKQQETLQELLYQDYKTVQGVRQPGRVIVLRDGKRFADTQYTDIMLLERLDDSTFAEP